MYDSNKYVWGNCPSCHIQRSAVLDPNTLLFNSLFFHLFRSESDSPSLSYEGNIETDRFEVQILQCKGGKFRSREQVFQRQILLMDGRIELLEGRLGQIRIFSTL